jgi:signal transduction histidine kinase
MAARTLEARLRGRLLAALAPAFALVALASVGVTSRALDAADDEMARGRARAVLHALAVEIGEGDTLPVATREALEAAEGDGVRARLRGVPDALAGSREIPPSLVSLAEGTCGEADDARGQPWRACAVTDGAREIVLAVGVSAHHAVVRTLAESMLAVVLLALLAAVWAARVAVTRPLASLGALVAWSERAPRDRASPPPPPPPAGDAIEVDRLAASFDALVRQLMDAVARARATSAHIAHELRTPLTALRAELDAVAHALAPGPLPASPGRAVARMQEDVARIERVIDAILVLASDEGAARIDSVVNVADVARKLAPAGTDVRAPDEALVDADPRLIELALSNLLENAVKYGGGRAEQVLVSRAGDGVRLAVVDDGPGLDAAARARMFERYWRAAGASDGEGRGLGLALVRAVAERHGGVADARPNASGTGLDVGLTLGPLLGWHDAAGDAPSR